jgi:hypothetical protein
MPRQALKQKAQPSPPAPAEQGADRGTVWAKARGMWKNRKPDPIKEWQKLRKEWDREPA